MGNIFGDRLTTCLFSDWPEPVKFQQPKYSIKHNFEQLIVLIHNYSVKPVTNKSNLSVCLSVIFFVSLCSAELAKETYFHVKLWDHSSANQPVPGIQIEGRGAKNRMQFYCFNFIIFLLHIHICTHWTPGTVYQLLQWLVFWWTNLVINYWNHQQNLNLQKRISMFQKPPSHSMASLMICHNFLFFRL